MAGIDQILYVGLVGAGLYLAWSGGFLDQAGQALVNATAGKQQGFAKHHRHRKEILVPIVPVQPRMRLTFA